MTHVRELDSRAAISAMFASYPSGLDTICATEYI